ncbi:hypothetical protein [Pontibacter rugosus]|uniref:Uncharacterized protein n=1 Tax=Pontibacter rugosus TaxID=1745966 RepID=A0ABW3SUF3_9BACT
MLTYEQLPSANRTIAAILLLVVFMALVMADLFLSYLGGLVLGLLLAQFGLEIRMFYRRRKTVAKNSEFDV